jgi:hypothetical protein
MRRSIEDGRSSTGAETSTCAAAGGVGVKIYEDRNQGIVVAYATGEYSYQQIADFYGLHFTTIGKILRKARALQ